MCPHLRGKPRLWCMSKLSAHSLSHTTPPLCHNQRNFHNIPPFLRINVLVDQAFRVFMDTESVNHSTLVQKPKQSSETFNC
jgi:hypothetical protein